MTPTRGYRCRYCDGAGQLRRAQTGKRGTTIVREAVMMECSVCKGSGTITATQNGWRRKGKRHRQWREAQKESLRACARRIGMDVQVVMECERGMRDPRLLLDIDPVPVGWRAMNEP
jgi:DnaJ-class molecular chaperone